MNLDVIRKIYFLGIGGIGMSALARYFQERDVEVHGYDKTETTLTRKLVEEGMTIHYQEDVSKIPDAVDLVVWTPAVPNNHLELMFFHENKIPVKKRAEVLGIISRSSKTVAVAGTHGKTTTSSMVTHVLHTGGIKATAFLGGLAQNWNSNYVSGIGEWVVAEADEFDRSFLQLSPDIAILLSMDPDHLDIYGDKSQVQETGYKEFLKKVKPGGKIFVNENLRHELDNVNFETFGVGAGTYRAMNIRVGGDGFFEFDFESDTQAKIPGISWKSLRLSMPGSHNVENASAAVAVGLHLGIGEVKIREALSSFGGIVRRFQFIFRSESTVFIDAHHPTEIRSLVKASRELFPGRRITGIFQPHLFTRTRDFQEGFAEELDKLDEIILLDIYPAREEPIPGITSQVIFEKMKNHNKTLTTKIEVMEQLAGKRFDILLTIGAGDIDTLVEPIKEILINQK
jgi:UDP-N-acetylmuramate--alanine ligase